MPTSLIDAQLWNEQHNQNDFNSFSSSLWVDKICMLYVLVLFSSSLHIIEEFNLGAWKE